MSESNGVSYSVKELLSQINDKVDKIDAKLDQKADRDRVHVVENRVAALELVNAGSMPVLNQVVDVRKDVEDLKSWRNRLIGAFGLALFVGAAGLARALGYG